jgi:hypothetical protein
MTRRLIAAAFCFALLHSGAVSVMGKKKPAKRVLERFVVTSGSVFAAGNLDISIEEFSTDSEMQNLQKVFETGGERALESALGKSEKGFFKTEDGFITPLLFIRSSPEGTGRILQMVGRATSYYKNAPIIRGTWVQEYSYSFIQLEVDGKGNGKGRLIPRGSLGFSKEGHVIVQPSASGYVPLTNVRLEK